MGIRMKSLISKTFSRFAACCVVLFAVSAPLFYFVTKQFYAEDMIDIIRAVNEGHGIPPLDLERDIMVGMMIQFVLIFVIVTVPLYITMRFVTRKLWHPFDDTLEKTERFNVSQSELPVFISSDVIEFDRLNRSLEKMMLRGKETYRIQKEFTENASHELQTPLAVTRCKLDLLIQEGLTAKQLGLVSELFDLNIRMEHLNRNLLLLAKIENDQYGDTETIKLNEFIRDLTPSYSLLKSGCNVILKTDKAKKILLSANRTLLESFVNNLAVNALRHTETGDITIKVSDGPVLNISNPGETPLNGETIFQRFHSENSAGKGTGLGLAIVKAICDYHGWHITYSFQNHSHIFTVDMK